MKVTEVSTELQTGTARIRSVPSVSKKITPFTGGGHYQGATYQIFRNGSWGEDTVQHVRQYFISIVLLLKYK